MELKSVTRSLRVETWYRYSVKMSFRPLLCPEIGLYVVQQRCQQRFGYRRQQLRVQTSLPVCMVIYTYTLFFNLLHSLVFLPILCSQLTFVEYICLYNKYI